MKPLIHSAQNQQIKQVAKLRDASTRRESGYFIIDGETEIRRALEAGYAMDSLYFPVEGADAFESLLGRFESDQLQPVSSAVMRKLAYGDRDSGLVAVAKTPSLDVQLLKLKSNSLILVLDRIEKPGNLGACLRTATATGVAAVLLTNPICDVFNPNTIRASRGCLFSVPLAVATPTEVVTVCERARVPLFCARVDGAVPFWEADFRGGAAIVLGNEADGLGEFWAEPRCKSIHIPMHDATDSLNVSISAAVTLYEAMRQQR